MYKDRRIAVVIPAFNVARHIADVVKAVPDFIDVVIVVEDAATDETAKVVRSLEDPRLTVVHHPINQGVGAAMATGFRTAIDRGVDIVVKMDGDGQMDPQFLPALLDPIVLDGYAYSKGNRFLWEDQLSQMPTLRLVGSFGLT